MEEATKKEILETENESVIFKVDQSDWAFPIVPVVKPSEGQLKIRITGDFKKLNIQLQLPVVVLMATREKLLQIVDGAKLFTTIDLEKAYHQLRLAADSRKYATIATPWGFYRYNNLPQGLSSAPGEFQQQFNLCCK